MQTNNTPVVQKPKIEVLKDIMKAPSIQEQFNNVLKENSGVFVASIIDLYNSDKNLQNCEPKQVVMEALKAAVLKLPVNKSLGFAYIVPYNESYRDGEGNWQKKQVPQMQIGYKGLIQLAMRTGQYRIINADLLYEGELKTVNKLTGEIDMSGERTSDKVVGYFAHIEMLNGFTKTLYSTVDKISAHAKKYSKSFSSKNSPWTTEFDAMAIKTVLRNLLSHYGFLSVEMIGAMAKDIEGDTVGDEVDQTIQEKANRVEMKFDDAEVVEETETKEQNPI
ncbi:recombinase RecT [Chitinophaga sp. GCM10012297]|uniref:Recombinase RecT n=1 Tax=Chitinophaga chungangae TaxID=2821488 RepID=A0ABS3YB64_9BACT|nr:recombinase RecT [Chitinophaga chungangae]MBO9151908.1 recombinase RecT [Chitinophaga chungangae]